MEGMEKMERKPIKITDTTLRDGHQSCLATRMRTEDMIPIAADLDQAGFHSVEMWGGATFDVAHRFLGEDPWERVRTLKKADAQDSLSDASPRPEPGRLSEPS